jgi:hypothetical protein
MSNALREAVYFSILSMETVAHRAEFEVHTSLNVSKEDENSVEHLSGENTPSLMGNMFGRMFRF